MAEPGTNSATGEVASPKENDDPSIPVSPRDGGFELDTQGDLDYEELLEGEDEGDPSQGAKDPLESSEDPLEGDEDPLQDDDLLGSGEGALESGDDPLEGGDDPLEGGDDPLEGGDDPLDGGDPLKIGEDILAGSTQTVAQVIMWGVVCDHKITSLLCGSEQGRGRRVRGQSSCHGGYGGRRGDV
jgi:hypothetical protein